MRLATGQWWCGVVVVGGGDEIGMVVVVDGGAMRMVEPRGVRCVVGEESGTERERERERGDGRRKEFGNKN